MEMLERIKPWYEKVGSLAKSDVDWLIKQAEQLDKIKKLSNSEDIALAEFAKEVLIIIEGREKETRKRRT
jgi:hypothetical protein